MTLERFLHRMGVCFVENNARQILNKWDFPVRHGEKRFLCPFSKHDPYYLSKFPLNFNGYFICGGTTHCDKKDVSHEISDMWYGWFYCDLNIHQPHKYCQNKQIGEVPSADRQSAGLQNVCASQNVQTRFITSCIFDMCYTFVWTVLHAEQW